MSHIDEIKKTALWEIMEQKAEEENRGTQFVPAVENVCSDALAVVKTTILHFPAFTLHDGTHCVAVCKWMDELVGKKWRKKLTAQEAALLLMAACCHDIGMCVAPEHEDALKSKLKEELEWPESNEWSSFFQENPGKYQNYRDTGCITEEMLRWYVRRHHHERVRDNFEFIRWDAAAFRGGDKFQVLLWQLCRSHGISLTQWLGNNDEHGLIQNAEQDMKFVAIILRLADLLDYDGRRVPEALFRFLGVDSPKDMESMRSVNEQMKTQAGQFRKSTRRGVLLYEGTFSDPNLEDEVQKYLQWVQRELDECNENLNNCDARWTNFSLPIQIKDVLVRNGYSSKKFSMMVDRERSLELLSGKDLYSDPGVFVRELLQNAIDAVLVRVKKDRGFRKEDGRILIDTWPAENGDTWFRIRDNGIGMDEHIIKHYFLNVGRSYYESPEFRFDNERRAPGDRYTSISRFGIGILSCFREDPKGTELCVSTRRFRSDDNNCIRLNVKGLHGNYYLLLQKDKKEYSPDFLKMPTPDQADQNWGYRKEPGTTICVRVNLDRAGCTKSFREILDRYVKFPEVRVQYHNHCYPTRDELMGVVHELNPGDEVQEHVHEITDAQFEELQEALPGYAWSEKPAVVLKYTPLERLSGTEALSGVGWSIGVRCNVPERTVTDNEGNHYNVIVRTECQIRGREKLEVRFYETGFFNRGKAKVKKFLLALTGADSILGEKEKVLFRHLLNTGLLKSGEHNLVAYQGVLAGKLGVSGGTESGGKRMFKRRDSIILLGRSFRPEVGLDRAEIRSLSPEAACCCAMTFGTRLNSDPSFIIDATQTRLLTRRELRGYIDAHAGWREKLTESLRENMMNEELVLSSRMLYHRLMLSALDPGYVSRIDFSQWANRFSASIEESADQYEWMDDFPAGLFFLPKGSGDDLAVRFSLGYVYNAEHAFSRWIVEHRKDLEQKAPELYRKMILTMEMGREWREIRSELNAILRRLRSSQDDIFGIGDLQLE